MVNIPFLHSVWMVLFGEWPQEQEKSRLKTFMCKHSRLTHQEIELLRHVPRKLHPMLMLQGMIPLLELPEEQSMDMELNAEQGLFLAAKITALIAAHYRLGQSKVVLAPTPGRLFHENFLTMFHGRAPSPEQVQMLNAAQILQMEHSFNAGTFAGRVCASTLAPIQSVISVAELIVVPTRPSPHDLRAVGATVDLCERAGKPLVFVVNAATPKAKITSEAAVALSQHGTVAPITLHHRTDFAASMIDGRTVMEVDPDGRSAAEITALWKYISDRLEKNFRRTVFATPGSGHQAQANGVQRPAGGFGRRVAQ